MKAIFVNNKNHFDEVVNHLINNGYEMDDPHAIKECSFLTESGESVTVYTHNKTFSCVASNYFDEEVDEVLAKTIGESFEIYETVTEFKKGVKNA